ncbi:MAG: Glycine cleavage system regulatory protein [Verrucomicrobia bacterium]|jgi:glycine cleavage system regulatory protein|nr:MAG: Glycine cleavage system regulatory protein [Verrucomicrobiota bacterium]
MAGNVSLVVTLVGPDRPGVVKAVSTVVAAHGGNWVESRMARLAGQFAGIVHVEVPEEEAGALRGGLESLGLSAVVVETLAHEPVPRVRHHLELLGHDRPGIVRDLSQALAARGINVIELETECISAPWTGEILFKAVAELCFPDGTSLEQVRTDLAGLSQELHLEIDLTPPPEAPEP